MTTEEMILEKLGNIATALEQDEQIRKKQSNIANFKSWGGIILAGISIMGFMLSPFMDQRKKLNELDNRINTVQFVVWDKVPGADQFLENPYRRTRGGSSDLGMKYEPFKCIK